MKYMFRVREVKDGACTQYSYDGEEQYDVLADSAAGLRSQLEERYGAKLTDIRKIGAGYWAHGFALTFANNAWVRAIKVAQ